MFEDSQLGPEILANPGQLQFQALQELDNRLNGTFSIADPNNGFNQMLEIGSSFTAQVTAWMESNFGTIYAKRSTTAKELYPHMSDFDYLQLTYGPAETGVKFLLSRKFILDNAVQFNSSYNKLVIPVDTIFTVGSYSYGIYYPIEIRVNRLTNAITCVYDTTTTNPLFALSTNLVPLTEWVFNNIPVVTLTIPVYQFSQSSVTYDASSARGFQQTISYTDNFYAVRAFTNNTADAVWTEMQWTLSENYDVTAPTVATIRLSLQPDNNTIVATIPQIYFTLGLIGTKVKIVVFTTQGAIDIQLSDAEIQKCNITLQPTSDNWSSYAAPLSKMKETGLSPVDSRIVGGSNGLSFAELRQRVVYNEMDDPIAITPLQLAAFGAKNGFSIGKPYVDNITNRIYYASKQMTGGALGTIPVTVANIKLDNETLGGTSSVKQFPDNMMTVFPTTVYLMDTIKSVGIPLSDTQMQQMASLSNDALCKEMNTNTYTQYPYHLVVYTDPSFPLARSFDLMNPSVPSISFLSENVNSASQMTLVNAGITHQGDGTGGYLLQLAVNKTADLAAIDEQYLYVILSTTDQAGSQVIVRATKQGDAPAGAAYTTVYQVAIPTSYHISQDGFFESQLYSDLSTTVTCDLSLNTTFKVTFLADSSALSNPIQDANITLTLPNDLQGYIGLTQQSMNVVFGTDVSSGIYNIVNAALSSETYMKYPQDVYLTYKADVYATDPTTGGLLYTVSDGKVIPTKLHSAGDFVLDASGNKIVQHPAGSTMLDPTNLPILNTKRHLVYYVQAMQFDSRLFQSSTAADQEYTATITRQISSYVNTVETMAESLFEQTNLYFLPVNTIGSASFDIGNGKTTTYDLGLAFAFNVGVTQATYDDPSLMAIINEQIIAQVNIAVTNPVISMSDIIEVCKENLAGDILSLDSLGINGNPALQTLRVITQGAIPAVELILVSNPDGSLSLQQNITINPVVIGEN